MNVLSVVSEDRNRELIPCCWRSHRYRMFANIQLSYSNKTADLRVQEISEKCSSLTKYVGYIASKGLKSNIIGIF